MSAPVSPALVASQAEDEVGKLLGIEGLLNPAVRVIAIKGSPGAGKTTLLRLIAGLETATSGRIELDGCCFQQLEEVGH